MVDGRNNVKDQGGMQNTAIRCIVGLLLGTCYSTGMLLENQLS
jgi:hypothetical protein